MFLSHRSIKVPRYSKVPVFNGFWIDEEDNGHGPVNTPVDDSVCILTVFGSYRDQKTGQTNFI